MSGNDLHYAHLSVCVSIRRDNKEMFFFLIYFYFLTYIRLISLYKTNFATFSYNTIVNECAVGSTDDGLFKILKTTISV